MDLRLKGKVALVAGASKGLGKAVAVGFAAEGVKVAICARSEVTLRPAADEIARTTKAEVLAIPADVTKPEDAKRLVDATLNKFGRIDILVTNAGGPPAGQFVDFTDQQWLDAVNLNLMSAVRLISAVVPQMKKQGGGCIITMTSVAVKQPIDNLILSNAVRLGVVGLTKSLANELAKDNIRVNSVCPGWTRTERIEELFRAWAARAGTSPREESAKIEKDIPMGRMGTPEEFANVVVFLASERASYVTGTALQIDGGFYRRSL
jgi:3-oxoacyl-[acyl-carrier protein] reductase